MPPSDLRPSHFSLWDEQAPAIQGMTIALGGDEVRLALRWTAPLDSWCDGATSEEHLVHSLTLLERFAP